jgi:hypothetical protein
VFPDSADANGSGALFVGWLSEIFPELERKAWAASVPKGRETTRGKRPRERPKGSKVTKVRKDKGIKKGPKDSSRERIQVERSRAACRLRICHEVGSMLRRQSR